MVEEETELDWEEFVGRVYRKAKRIAGIQMYLKGLVHFRLWLGPSTTLTKWFVKARPEKEENVVKTVDDFVKYLDEKGVSGGSIRGYVAGIKGALEWQRISISDRAWKYGLTLPQLKYLEDDAPSDEQALKIVGTANGTMKPYLMTLNDTGLRLMEAAQLMVWDMHLDEKPVRISIRAQTTKNQRPREVFITDETEETIRQLIKQKNKQNSDYVFFSKISKNTRSYINIEYIKILKRAGLDQKIEGHTFYKLHIHTWRKRFFTAGIEAGIPAEIVHAMKGEKRYLDEYLKLPIEKKREYARKLFTKVAIFKKPETKVPLKEFIVGMAKAKGYSDEEIKNLEVKLGEFMRPEDIDWKSIGDILGITEKKDREPNHGGIG